MPENAERQRLAKHLTAAANIIVVVFERMIKHNTRVRTGIHNHLSVAVEQLGIVLRYGVNMALLVGIKEIASHSQYHQHSGNDR